MRSAGKQARYILQRISRDQRGFITIFSPPPPIITRSRAIRTADLAIAANVTTVITWQAVSFDNAGIWNVANPTRLTIPTSGVWVITAGAWETLTVGTAIALYLRKNGADIIGGGGGSMNSAITGDGGPGANMASLQELVAGDYLELMIRQSVASTLLADSGRKTFFSAALIGV